MPRADAGTSMGSDAAEEPRADAGTNAGSDAAGEPRADAGTNPGADASAADGADVDSGAPDASTRSQPDECAESNPDWVFCHSFEAGDFDVWDDYDGNPSTTNSLPLDPGPFQLEDNHVLRLHVPPGRGGADVVKLLPSGHRRLYARWFAKWESGYDFSAPNHGGGLHAGARDLLGHSDDRPNGDDWFTAWIEPMTDTPRLNLYSYYRGMYMDCADPSGRCWGDHFPCLMDEGEAYCTRPEHRETVLPPVLESDRWYCLEMLMDGGEAVSSEDAANGALDFWIDDQEVGPWEGLWMRTDPDVEISILWLSLFHHGDHSDAGLRIDDVVVSTSRVGCPLR